MSVTIPLPAPVSYAQPEVEAKVDAVLAHLTMEARRGSVFGVAAR